MKNKKFILRTGTDDFRKLISSDGLIKDPNYIFVDKTIFIKDFLEHGSEVLLVTRPRRWGKSLALSMIRYFLEKEVDGQPTAGLFQNLKIAEHITPGSVLEKHQGNYPVIIISFKDIKGGAIEEIELEIKEKIKDLFSSHQYLLEKLSFYYSESNFSNKVLAINIKTFESILDKSADYSIISKSLLFLSELLFKYNAQKVFILIDEYDNPINSNYDKPEPCEWLTSFFSVLFGSALKSNPYLEKGLITGVMRIAKAEIFSGLNNISERTILSDGFAEHYGFTEDEAFELIKKADLNIDLEEVRNWYNGYTIGDHKMYNPWSITQLIENSGRLRAYWVNTSSSRMMQKVFVDNAKSTDKLKVGQLLRRSEIMLEKNLSESISMDDIFYNSESVWSLMLHSGYLTICEKDNFKKVKLPNYEVKTLIEELIHVWFVKNSVFSDAANALLFGNMDYFFEAMSNALKDPSYSARIFNNKSSGAPSNLELKEFMYQFLVMTEIRCINSGSKDFEVIAEPESISFGKTRPDFIALNHPAKLCVVGEIKTLLRKETIEAAAVRALDQINKNNYGSKYKEEGYRLIKLGIAFAGTDVEMIWEE